MISMSCSLRFIEQLFRELSEHFHRQVTFIVSEER